MKVIQEKVQHEAAPNDNEDVSAWVTPERARVPRPIGGGNPRTYTDQQEPVIHQDGMKLKAGAEVAEQEGRDVAAGFSYLRMASADDGKPMQLDENEGGFLPRANFLDRH